MQIHAQTCRYGQRLQSLNLVENACESGSHIKLTAIHHTHCFPPPVKSFHHTHRFPPPVKSLHHTHRFPLPVKSLHHTHRFRPPVKSLMDKIRIMRLMEKDYAKPTMAKG